METRGIRSDIYEINLLCSYVEKKETNRLLLREAEFIGYWGRYLDEIDSTWADEKSIYYEKCYMEGCRLLAEEHFGNKEYEEAGRLYRNILRINCYEEESMEQLLLCYCQMGDWKHMKQLCCKFTKKFKEEMGIESMISLENILAKRCENDRTKQGEEKWR